MDGIKRNLLYWGYTIGLAVLMVLAMVFGISIVTELDELGNILRVFCTTISRYGVPYMLFFMGLLGTSTINIYMPFTLSMGSTRRDSFIGMEIMMHLAGLLLNGIIIAADIFTGNAVNGALFLGGVLLLAASAALCNLVGWAYLRFGKVVALILYVILVITYVFGMFVFEALRLAGKWSLQEKWEQPVLAAAAVAADCAVIWIYAREVKKVEVRV